MAKKKKAKRQTTVRRDPVDDKAIAIIRERFGATTDTAAIALALRFAATADVKVEPPEAFNRVMEALAQEVNDYQLEEAHDE
jgi:hypothetical protein